MLSSRRRSTATRAKFRAGELRARVLLLQRPDRIPVEVEFPGNIHDGGLATAPPYVVRKALGMEGVVRQEVEPLALHVAATLAQHAPHLDCRKDTCVATRKIANAPRAPAVPARRESTTASENAFFERRTRVMTRAFGSPETRAPWVTDENPETQTRPTSAVVTSLNWPNNRGARFTAPCEAPERQYRCGFHTCLRA